MTWTFAALAAVVLLAFTTEATAGFGSMLLAVTLGSLFLPVREVVPVVVPLNLILSAYLVGRHHAHVARAFLARRILPLMGAGLAAGQVLFRVLGPSTRETFLGALVVALAARELWRQRPAARGVVRPPLGEGASALWLLGAGVIHGLYATGGPPLVYVLGRRGLPKAVFRSTLAVVWLALNGVLTVVFLVDGQLGGAGLRRVALLAPVVAAAIVLGETLHRRVDEGRFRTVVFALLLVAGLVLLR